MQPKYIFSNVIGTFVFSEQFTIFDKILFSSIEDYENREKAENNFKNKYKSPKKPEGKELFKILDFFKNRQFFSGFYSKNLALTKKKVKGAVKDDILIIQSINCIEDTDKIINMLVKRLREWYSYYNPEFSSSVGDNEKFIELLIGKKDKKSEDSMGADLSRENLEPITELIEQANGLYALRKKQENYLEKLMKNNCPNLTAIAGVTIGAKLIEHANSLKHLAELPSSVIQLLGAEKALFRHLKTGARSPKYGILHEHPLISKAKKPEHGKIARALADKISIAVRVDYFKGKFIGDKLKKALEERFK